MLQPLEKLLMCSSIDRIADAVARIQELATHRELYKLGLPYHTLRPHLLEILDGVAEIRGAMKGILHD